jgi:hemerythrin
MSNNASRQDFPRAFSWRPELLLGIEQMDLQHRHLVACAGQLDSVVTANSSRQDVALSLAALVAVAKQHFEWEERLMLANRYDDYARHKVEHDRLLDQLLEVDRELAAGRIGPSQILSLFIDAWTVQHLLGADRQLAAFLRERAVDV